MQARPSGSLPSQRAPSRWCGSQATIFVLSSGGGELHPAVSNPTTSATTAATQARAASSMVT